MTNPLRHQVGIVLTAQILALVLGVLCLGLANISVLPYLVSSAVDVLFAVAVLLSVFLLDSEQNTQWTKWIQVVCALLVFAVVTTSLTIPDSYHQVTWVIPLVFVVAVGLDVWYWRTVPARLFGLGLLVAVLGVLGTGLVHDRNLLLHDGVIATGFLFWCALVVDMFQKFRADEQGTQQTKAQEGQFNGDPN